MMLLNSAFRKPFLQINIRNRFFATTITQTVESVKPDFKAQLLEYHPHFPFLTNNQWDQLNQLADLIYEWNSKINIVSRKDIDQLVPRHIIPCLSFSLAHTFQPGTNIIDVGTGGGFPGSILAISFPEVNFTLLDSCGKKIKVVEDIRSKIGLNNAKTIHIRSEDFHEKFDYIVARSVAHIDDFLTFSHHLIKGSNIEDRKSKEPTSGLLYLKGNDIGKEIKDSIVRRYKIIPLNSLISTLPDDKCIVYIPTEEIIKYDSKKVQKNTKDIKKANKNSFPRSNLPFQPHSEIRRGMKRNDQENKE